MPIIYGNVSGLDVHKKTVVAASSIKQTGGTRLQERQTFGTMTVDLLALSDWLLARGITHVADAGSQAMRSLNLANQERGLG